MFGLAETKTMNQDAVDVLTYPTFIPALQRAADQKATEAKQASKLAQAATGNTGWVDGRTALNGKVQ